MKITKDVNVKVEFEITGYRKPIDDKCGILVDVKLNPPVENVCGNKYLDSILIDAVLLNNIDTYEDILDSDYYRSIYFDDYPLLKLLFKDEYELMNYLYNGINEYARERNIPAFFQDPECISDEHANKILDSISNDEYNGIIEDSDDINDSYKLKWEISNYSIKISNKYLEKVYLKVNRNNVNHDNLMDILYNFWSEWNDIIPGNFKW